MSRRRIALFLSACFVLSGVTTLLFAELLPPELQPWKFVALLVIGITLGLLFPIKPRPKELPPPRPVLTYHDNRRPVPEGWTWKQLIAHVTAEVGRPANYQDIATRFDLDLWLTPRHYNARCVTQPIIPAAERSSAPQREETTMPSYEGASAKTIGRDARETIEPGTLGHLFQMTQQSQSELENQLDDSNVGGIRNILNQVVDARAEYRQRIGELNSLEDNIRNYLHEASKAASTKDPGPTEGPASGAYAQAARG